MNTNSHTDQLLLISASERRFELQNAIAEATRLTVSVAATFDQALSAIALSPYLAVILDEGLADLNPSGADQFLARCNDELPIYVKLAISGVPRCLQQVQLALRRFERERRVALSAAQNTLRSQMRDALTTISICGQLVLKASELTPGEVKHLESILAAGETLQKVISPANE